MRGWGWDRRPEESGVRQAQDNSGAHPELRVPRPGGGLPARRNAVRVRVPAEPRGQTHEPHMENDHR